MLKKIATIAARKNIPAELSLESVMGCGFGACWGCVKKIKKDRKISWHKICEEGPVLKAEDIIWEIGNNE
jgi:dihydroorotate dehydrogenase electron transfer subunit